MLIAPVIAALVAPSAQVRSPSPADEIAGRWTGASTCTTVDWNAVCNDERMRIRCILLVLPRGLMSGRLLDVDRSQIARTVRVQADSIQTPPPQITSHTSR